MKILFVSAETAPYSMVGGLSQVTYFLAKALIKLGHDVRIFTPAYGCISNLLKFPKFSNLPQVVFYQNKFFFGSRQNIYGYKDDPARFAAFSKGCLDWLLRSFQKTQNTRNAGNSDLSENQKSRSSGSLNLRLSDISGSPSFPSVPNGLWFPDVIHCHDWHTGMLIHWLKNDPKYSALKNIPVLYTVHNFSYQGVSPNPPTSQNPLALGLLSADFVNTVSPTHAKEVMTPKYANGLLPILKKIQPKLTGILNGLDTEEFNPATDKNIEFNYSNPAGRAKNKICLQQLFGLSLTMKQCNHETILLAFSARLCPQKGIDLILKTLPRLLTKYSQTQFIALGNGDSSYKTKLAKLAKSFPGQVGPYLKSDFSKPRQIFAGADVMLIPSRFEPCGIIALEALRYGCVPLVHRTGGLNDIVQDFDPKTGKGNGFSFSCFSAKSPNSPKFPNHPNSFFSALASAIKIYQNKSKWCKLVQNCLACDFSWDHSALKYEKLFLLLLGQS